MKKPGGYGVDPYALAELARTLGGHIGGEVADAGLGCSISADARHRAESGHGREVDDGATALLHHRAQEDLRRDDGAREVEVEDGAELGRVEVEEGPVGGYRGARHVASGGVQEGINAAVAGKDVVAVLLQLRLVKNIGFKETSLSASGNDVSHYGVAHLFLTSEYDNLRTFCSQIFSDSATQHACTACDDDNVVFDIE